MFSVWEVNQLSLHPFLWRVIFVPSISLVSYFLADHLILRSLANRFRNDHLTLCLSSLKRVILILYPLASYFRADHLTVHPSISWESYLCVVHSFGKLFSCRPFNCPSVHPFGELFSCRPFNCPSVHPFGELFSCRPFNCPSVHPFGGLFLCRPFPGRAIFVPSISLVNYFWQTI